MIEQWDEELQNLTARLEIINDLTGSSFYNRAQRTVLLKEGRKILKQIIELNNKMFVEQEVLKYINMANEVDEASEILH